MTAMPAHRFYLAEAGGLVSLRAPKPAELRTYRAAVKRVIDGDTIVADLYLDFRDLVATDQRMRFAGGNAAEHNTEAGAAATANLMTLLPAGTQVTVRVVSETADPHGRLLVTVTLPDLTDLIALLIEQQWLAPWDGHGEAPVPPWPRTVGALSDPTGGN